MPLARRRRARLQRGYACACCAGCCREMVVPVNDADVRRLAAASGLPPAKIVGFYSSRHVDFDADSPLWVRTHHGPRIMALKRAAGQRCRFLSAAGRCRHYDQRPSTCRTFPYEIRFAGGSRPSTVERTDWDACQAASAMVADLDEVVRARRRELSEDRQFRCRLRAWEASGNGRTADLIAYLFDRV